MINSSEEVNDLSIFFDKPCNLNLDKIRTVVKQEDRKLIIEGESLRSLKEFSRKEGITLSTIMQFS